MDFTIRGTMIEAMLNTPIGSGRSETIVGDDTLSMMWFLQGKTLTFANMDRLGISKEQVLVALINQLVQIDMASYASGLMRGVTSVEGLRAISWKPVMALLSHEDIPDSWRKHAFGCLDKHNKTALESAIEAGDEERALNFLESSFGSFGCRRVRRDGQTAFMMAVRQGMESVAMRMLSLFGAGGCHATNADEYGDTALMYACEKSLENVALQLLDLGKDGISSWDILGASCIRSRSLRMACENDMEVVALRILDMYPACGHDIDDDEPFVDAFLHACKSHWEAVAMKSFRMHRVLFPDRSFMSRWEFTNTPLMRACDAGMGAVALKLIEAGPKLCFPGMVSKEGDTALMIACCRELTEVALALIQMGSDVCGMRHVFDCDEEPTALLIACNRNMEDVALALLKAGPDACRSNYANRRDETPLLLACKFEMERVALALIEMGPNACGSDCVGRDGYTPLIVACENNMERVALALIEMGIEACLGDHIQGNDTTAMSAAVENDMVNVVIALAQKGVDQENMDGGTPLLWACSKGDTNTALTLIETGQACMAHQINDYVTALFVACENNMERVALALIEMGSEECRADYECYSNTIYRPDKPGSTALMVACENKMERVALALIEMGVEECRADHVDKYGDRAITHALNNDMLGVVIALIHKGAKQCVDQYETVLIWACNNDDTKTALALIEMGPEACHAGQVHGNNGDTALIAACENDMERVALALIEMGPGACRADHVNHKRDTALIAACENKMERVALALIEMGPEACRADHVNESGKRAIDVAKCHLCMSTEVIVKLRSFSR